MERLATLAAVLLGLCGPVHAQEFAAIGAGPAQGFRLEGAGFVQPGAPPETALEDAAPAAQDAVHYLGGPAYQAGAPNAGDTPVRRLPPADVFRSQYSLTAPKAEEPSPIVAKAREFMANPPYNPDNGTHDWNGWCLGFVYTTLKAARGKGDSQMAQPAAKDAYYAMAAAGRTSKDFSAVPAGAALLWAGCSQWGHAAIATGELSADGTPIMITTTQKGIREMSTKQFGCGLPSGWGKI